jgi:transposase-like protein
MSVAQIAEEEGISMATLFNWKKQARAEGSIAIYESIIFMWGGVDVLF